MQIIGKTACAIAVGILLTLGSCDEVNDDRIPRMPVNIEFTHLGMWETYGVTGFGSSRRFIIASGMVEPAGFPYNTQSRTGFGGVLLIMGQSIATGNVEPLAYDLSCPVERLPDVRVYVDATGNFDAVCPKCGSHYNVVEAGGSPVAGQALDFGYGLRRYYVYGTINGGYIITDY